MIRNRWYAVLEASEVRRGRPLCVMRFGIRLAFWREDSGRVACVADRCPHRGASLGRGTVADGCIVCPYHGFRFDSSGACRRVPSSGAAPLPRWSAQVFPVEEAHGFVWLWWGDAASPLPPVPWFSDVDEAEYALARDRDLWPVHYTRVVENQLDLAHLPFVHARTIGRDQRTVVDGPVCEMEGDLLSVWDTCRRDDGTPAVKPSLTPRPPGPPIVQFRFPNLWRLRVRERSRLVIAIVPVDEGRTALYIRFYQRAPRAFGLRELLNWAQVRFGRRIGAEDRRVVLYQSPSRSDASLEEHLVPADYPIALFRRRRRELLEASEPLVPSPESEPLSGVTLEPRS